MEEDKTQQEQKDNHYTPLVNSTAANPYKDQQYLPGQTIGYGLPTDQKIINYTDANKPVRDYRPLKRKLLLLTIALIPAAAAYWYFMVR